MTEDLFKGLQRTNNRIDRMTPQQLAVAGHAVARAYPSARLVRIAVTGNLAVFHAGEPVGWIDLNDGSVHLDDEREETP